MTDVESILASPFRRLTSVYSCREEGTGRAIPFKPRPEQMEVFRLLEERPTDPIYIIKSRRLGLSTALCTYQSDKAAFSRGWRGILIDQTQADATKKMEEIIRFSIDNLPPELLSCYEFPKRNDTQLRLRIANEETETQDSVIYATTSGRGGDCSMLHVSEWGPIQATDAKRSAEIRSGSFPAARKGRRCVETTWMGGKAGDLWELISPILESNPQATGSLLFFPWHSDPAAIQLDGKVPAEVEDYFFAISSKLGKTFSREQKLWWVSKKLEQGLFMSREYPSTLEEAFQAPIEGAVYARLIDEARSQKRITPLPHDPSHMTWTFWDIGSPRNTRLIYVQFIGHAIHVIDHDDGALEMTPAQRVAHMHGKGYHYAAHFLPHDGDNTTAAGASFRQQLAAAGLPSIRCLPRCRSEWPGINKAAEILPRCWFSLDRTENLISSLSYYHTKKDMRDGVQTDILVDDWSAHDADAFRMLAEALLNNLIPSTSPVVQHLRPHQQRQKKAIKPRR
jgi:hypothetical protein